MPFRVALLLATLAGILDSIPVAAEDPPSLDNAVRAYRRGEMKEAVREATRYLEQHPNAAQAHQLRAAAYDASGQYVEAIADWTRCIQQEPDNPGGYQARGETRFKAGRVEASISDFDRFLEFRPERKPHHWQRGISLYYAGEHKKGVEQFELHKSVNPQDVENGIWHFLCNARLVGVDRARQALIDISQDPRPWAMVVYRMFQGQTTPQAVLRHAEQSSRGDTDRHNNLFYAHLYIGLYNEALGEAEEARRNIRIAVEKHPSSHYMGHVARVHLKRMSDTPP